MRKTSPERYAHLAMSNLHEAVSRIQNPSDPTTDTSTTEAFAYVQ